MSRAARRKETRTEERGPWVREDFSSRGLKCVDGSKQPAPPAPGELMSWFPWAPPVMGPHPHIVKKIK